MLSVIIPAAGKSRRMQGEDKLCAMLGGKPVLAYSMELFENADECDEIILVTDNAYLREIAVKYAPTKLKACVSGGMERADSVRRGVEASCGDYICIHDAARPNLRTVDFQEVLAAARQYGAAILAAPVHDTVKSFDENGILQATLDRNSLCLAQTPQIFRRDMFLQALSQAYIAVTDEAALLQQIGCEVHIVQGSKLNFKLTVSEDMQMMQALYRNMRVGSGYDAHRLAEGRKLILGGVDIPHEQGLLGHSDADVLLHAICDALLGAAALGDIGKIFPDSDMHYKDISSLILLQHTGDLLSENGYRIANIDSTVIAQRPKLAPYIEQMRANIAATLGIDTEQISVKATTTEGMGFTGLEEGIAAEAKCLLYI